jgi:hypothetical protein
MREHYIASALARKFNASLHFNTSDDLAKWDFVLYSIEDAWATSVEMQDDYYMKTEDDSICLELLTHIDEHTSRNGKLNYTKAKRLLYVINNMNLILSLKVSKLRQLVAVLESVGELQTYTPHDFDAWRATHDTNPTTCALLPMQDVLLNDPNASVFTFDELQIPHNYKQLKL